MKIKTVNNIKLHIAADYNEASVFAAELIVKAVDKKPNSSLLLSTGTSQRGIFQHLCDKYPKRFELVSTYNMYEYCLPKGQSYEFISSKSPQSFKRYMNEFFFEKIKVASHHFPSIRNVTSPGEYDDLIDKNGGIDVALAAIGEDGHTFGFNLPGTSFISKTRLVTIDAFNKGVINSLTSTATPDNAVTVGLGTGMNARNIVFITSGVRKAKIFKSIIYSEVSPVIPATILKTHPNCTWIVDEAVTSEL